MSSDETPIEVQPAKQPRKKPQPLPSRRIVEPTGDISSTPRGILAIKKPVRRSIRDFAGVRVHLTFTAATSVTINLPEAPAGTEEMDVLWNGTLVLSTSGAPGEITLGNVRPVTNDNTLTVWLVFDDGEEVWEASHIPSTATVATMQQV